MQDKKNNLKLFILILTTLTISNLRCQVTEQKNNFVYLEGLGSGGYYSLNFEKTISKHFYGRTYLRAGFSVFYDDWIKDNYPEKPFTFFLTYNFPLYIGNEIGTRNLHYEYGLGLVTSVGENVRHYNMLTAHKNSIYGYTLGGLLGLRYNLKKSPVFFRLTYTPFYEILTKEYIYFWFGASVGYKF